MAVPELRLSMMLGGVSLLHDAGASLRHPVGRTSTLFLNRKAWAALRRLVAGGAQLRAFPKPVMQACFKAAG